MNNKAGLKTKRGFTLIELLVVMAISVILLGLVMYPVVRSFSFTRQATAMTEAQDAARAAMEMISRDLGEAMIVFDNSAAATAIFHDTATPSDLYANQEGPIQLPVRQADGSIQCFTLQDAKIDFVLPRITMHCSNPGHPAGQPRDYDRGDEAWPPCPVCGSTNVEAKPAMPLKGDTTVVRYFLGLRYNDPTKRPGDELAEGEGIFGWKSPYLTEAELGEENQVVLYRAEFDPSDPTLFPPGMSLSQKLTDPIFFYRANYCKRWAEIARVVGIGKYEDLIDVRFDNNGNVVAVDPTVSFRFTAVDNETFSGAYSQSKNFEYPNVVPTIFEANYGYWLNGEGITVSRNTAGAETEFTTEYVDVGGSLHLMIMRRTGPGAGDPEFDITQYLNDLVNGTLTDLRCPAPNTGRTPEMAFIFDYSAYPDPAQPGKKMAWMNFNSGAVNFAITPPNQRGSDAPCVLDPAQINDDFYTAYDNDRGSARRVAALNLYGAAVVPGSERVLGPDMSPPVGRQAGPGGRVQFVSRSSAPVAYERVPLALGEPGANQYKIDYDNGIIYFSSVYDQGIPELYADGTAAQIKVYYKIHYNRAEDTVKGSYKTKSLVNIHLGMKVFDPDSGKPHKVELTNSVMVRNMRR